MRPRIDVMGSGLVGNDFVNGIVQPGLGDDGSGCDALARCGVVVPAQGAC